jgi:hypothetical protein
MTRTTYSDDIEHEQQVQSAVSALRATPDDDVKIEEIAGRLGWELDTAQEVALQLQAQRRIETDAGLGYLPTVVEGH